MSRLSPSVFSRLGSLFLCLSLFVSGSVPAFAQRQPASFSWLREVPRGAANPFFACREVSLPAQRGQSGNADDEAGAFLERFRAYALKVNQIRLNDAARVLKCLENRDSCSDAWAHGEIMKYEMQVRHSLRLFRIYMALASTAEFANLYPDLWSSRGEENLYSYLIDSRALSALEKRKKTLPFSDEPTHKLLSLPKITPLTESEILETAKVFNNDAKEMMSGFRKTSELSQDLQKGLRPDFDRKSSYFQTNILNLGRFYNAKYLELLSRFPVLSYYTQSEFTNKELARTLRRFQKNLKEFGREKLSGAEREWKDQKFLISLQRDVNEFLALPENAMNCALAHRLHTTVANEAFNQELVKQVVTFAAVSLCFIVTEGTAPQACIAPSFAYSALGLSLRYLELNREEIAAFRNTKKLNPRELEELRLKYSSFRLNLAFYVMSVGVSAGIFETSGSLLAAQVEKLLADRSFAIRTVAGGLAWDLAERGQKQLIRDFVARNSNNLSKEELNKLEADLNNVVETVTGLEKKLASGENTYYHQAARYIRTANGK